MEGETLDGKYQVVRLLGKGGMGSVYEAVATASGDRVAVKVINAHDTSKDKTLVSRFHREARAATAIDSEHVARVLDTGNDASGAPYMVMEYLEGEDLDQVVKRTGPLSPGVALRIMAQACEGLQKAHDARIIHRDIKPANLFLARKPGAGDGEPLTVKLLDFGIAKIKLDQAMVSDATGLTRTGSMLGSPLYMSPEQARGMKDIDNRTDVWSLGCVLYRMLAGRTPHEDIDALGDLIIAICSDLPRNIQDFAPWVTPEVAAAVHGALRFDPAERYASPAAMLEALRPLLVDGATTVTPSMLVPASDAERDVAAVRFAYPEPSAATTGPVGVSSARSSVIRVSGDDSDPSDVAATVRLEPASPLAAPTGASGPASAPLHAVAASPAPARAGNAPLAAAFVAVVALAGVGAYFGLRPAVTPTGATASAAPIAAPPPTQTTSSTGSPSAVVKERTVQLVVLPKDATVEVDGRAAPMRNGVVEIVGPQGSQHQVRLKKGKDETTGTVQITEVGASPPKLELAPKPGTK